MKKITITVQALLLLVLFAAAVDAQKKTPKKPKKPPVTKSLLPPLEVRAAIEKVDNQLANVKRFADVLGPIAQDIENLDELAKTKPLSEKATQKNEANKKKVIGAIRNLKAGLSDLEAEFRTKDSLKKYFPNIEGITDLAAASEDFAIAGKFVASKDPLREIARKLVDTLAALP